ncbi:polysaccharide deacetylase family protein [Niallia sp. XMNu-256]|uniref:polysaccharide deacetylase family protein n=1 Tax=Niallia sp. XMNu-256 TaxID=3082444 RepID=UPI0030D01560
MKKWFVVVILFIMAFLIVNNPLSKEYIGQIKGDVVFVGKNKNPLYHEIEMKASEYKIAASDAKIDPIWKALPGYNGIDIDVKASYDKMKKYGKFDENKLIYKQISPNTHLEDLPPSPIYKGHPEKPMVSFIINVAWGNEYLSSMLATLKKHHVSATFFLEGRWAQKNPDLAKLIDEAGHEVGNHSFSHPDMKNISNEKIRQEIIKTNEVIKATIGSEPKWFAPPSGSYRDDTVQIAAQEGLGTIMWSVDTIDWQKPTPDVLINRVMSKVHDGAIILMHPTQSTEQSLDELITSIKAKRLQIGTVSELLSEERIINQPIHQTEQKESTQ